MPLLTNIGVLYQCRLDGPQEDVQPIADAAIAWDGGHVQWVGSRRQIPREFAGLESRDAGGRMVIPGLVDCHTHLAFGGWRADEFELKLKGASYLEIARAGGGIASTVAKTRAASTEALIERCLGHLDAMLALGVTTVEAKSGYGLDAANELRLLRIYRDVASRARQRIVATLLAAHTVPPEFRDRRTDYVDLIVDQIIPIVAAEHLATFCDVFVEETAFTVPEARRIFEAGLAHGLRPKLHADQITNTGGAELAASVGAASADHLEKISDRGIAALAQAGVVAVSLPIASLYLNQPALTARRLIDAGAKVGVATDFNPGSAPSYHLPMAMMLACTMQRMTPREVLKGATSIAASAIGLEREVGSLEVGKRAHLALIDAESVEQWLYHFQANACHAVIVD